MEELYYAHPVQVRYWDCERHVFVGGIGYHGFVIDATTGECKSIIDIGSAAANENKSLDEAIVELDWLSLNRTILGN